MTIAIIGAGMAGLACAEALAAQGRAVRLYDKGRGPGGRMATRRTAFEGQTLRFDHGAQYFTARSPVFASEVARWCAAGAAAPWTARFADPSSSARYVGVPGMNAILHRMAGALSVDWGQQVVAIERVSANWWLACEGGARTGPFETVVIAVPPEQAAALLKPVSPAIAARAAAVHSRPCWAAMLACREAPDVAADAAKTDTGTIAWYARNNSKPGRGEIATYVVHASASWSEKHLELQAEDAAMRLAKAFRELTGADLPDYVAAHRWRYAQVDEPVGLPFLMDEVNRLATCGDWHLGARVEAAWTSGRALARHLLR